MSSFVVGFGGSAASPYQALFWVRPPRGALRAAGSGPGGVIRSTIFPGLWPDSTALLNGDLGRVLAVLQTGTESAEHVAFVEGLRSVHPDLPSNRLRADYLPDRNRRNANSAETILTAFSIGRPFVFL